MAVIVRPASADDAPRCLALIETLTGGAATPAWRDTFAALVGGAVDAARARGCAEMGLYLLERTEGNRPFYAKYGFAAVGTEMRQALVRG